jgi:gliding motility-associated-like protein
VKLLLHSVLLCIFLTSASTLKSQTTTSCFEIESILADACGAGSDEGLNEMVQILTGPNSLDIVDFDVQWATTTNPFQGFCQNGATTGITASINASIVGCGSVTEPPGGIIPPNSTVVIITSSAFDPLVHPFTNLNEDIYVLYQCGSTSGGNFANASANNPGNPRTLTLDYNGPSGNCNESVSYIPNSLVGGNGALVSFDFAGNPTYTNDGCEALVETLDPSWTPPSAICDNEPAFDLFDLLTGTPGGTWSGSGVTGSIFNATGLSGNIQVTYTLTPAGCASPVIETNTIIVNTTGNASWTIPSPICAGAGLFDLNTLITGTTGGTWSGTGVTGSNFDPAGLDGDYAITYSAGTGNCGETFTQNITVVASSNASWTPQTPVCEGDLDIDLATLLLGTAGGTWSGAGVTGTAFDPSGLSGNIAITYTVGTGACQQVSTQNINVLSVADASWTVPPPVCTGSAIIDLSLFVTGTPGGVWSGTGMTAANFNPAGISGAIAVTYSVGAGNCATTSTQNITVNAGPDPSWNFASPNICENAAPIDLMTLVTGLTGGTFTGTGVTASFFNPTGLNGSYTIAYEVSQNGCLSTISRSISVVTLPDPSWNTPATLCETDAAISLVGLITGTTGGTWSGTGVTGSSFNPLGQNGNINVTYNVGATGCSASETNAITVSQIPPVVTLTGDLTYCANGTVPTWSAAGAFTIRWYSDAGLLNLVSSGSSFTAPANPNPVTYYVVQDDGICVSAPSNITLTPIQIPAVPVVEDTTIWCEGTSIPTLNAFANNTIVWYNDINITNAVHTGPVFTPNLIDGLVFWLRAESNTCLSDTVRSVIVEVQNITAEILGNDTLSACLPVSLQLISADSINNFWSTGSSDTSIFVSRAGVYYLNRTGICNIAQDSVFVEDLSFNALFEVGNTEGFAPLNVPMIYTGSEASLCTWYIDGVETTPNFDGSLLFPLDTIYTVLLECENEEGCKSKAKKEVNIGNIQLLLPNTFTPDGDGVNDIYKPSMYGIQQLEMTIFNRWGEEVFSKSGLEAGWDGSMKSGKIAADGIYVCVVKAVDKKFLQHKLNSTILLIR